ncbi:unnamed protein product [Colias eurytheme]|nr:unnamed protein product [Colias eurytheme]
MSMKLVNIACMWYIFDARFAWIAICNQLDACSVFIVFFLFANRQALDDEFASQLEEQERLSENARLPLPTSSMPQHSSTLHSSRTSLTSSHYE